MDDRLQLNRGKLELLMAERALNHTGLAKLSGMSRATLSYAFNGKRAKPLVISKIAKALDVPVQEIVFKPKA